MRKKTAERVVRAKALTTKRTPGVVVKTRRAALQELDRRTTALVGKPSGEAFRLLEQGKFHGTIAEIELKMLRLLTA